MTKPLHGKVILITGGSAGIGKATALRFGKAGASVVIAARGSDRGESTLQEIRATGADAIFVQTDVSQTGQVQALLARTVERFGRLDCAFNNAAVLNRSARTGDYDQADFDTEVASNLRSVWLCMKYELEQMQKQQPCGGAIVNTSSINGLGGVRNAALYAMSKAGILALTKSAAQEYAANGIRVNALVAGSFDTEMLRNAVSQLVGDDPVKSARGIQGIYSAGASWSHR